MTSEASLTEESKTQLSVYSRWWHRLVNSDLCQRERFGAFPTAYRALLKRCTSLDEVMLTEAFQHLWLSLPREFRTPRRMELCALIAWVFAVVEQDTEVSLGSAMAAKADPNAARPKVSQLRFQQFVAARSVPEFARRLRRIVVHLKGAVSLGSLRQDVERWYWQNVANQVVANPSQRQTLRWAMEYYDSLPQEK